MVFRRIFGSEKKPIKTIIEPVTVELEVKKSELLLPPSDPNLSEIYKLFIKLQEENATLRTLLQTKQEVITKMEQNELFPIEQWLQKALNTHLQQTFNKISEAAAENGRHLSPKFARKIETAISDSETILPTINSSYSELSSLLANNRKQKKEQEEKFLTEQKQKMEMMTQYLERHKKLLTELVESGEKLLESKQMSEIPVWIASAESTVMSEFMQKEFEFHKKYGTARRVGTNIWLPLHQLISDTSTAMDSVSQIKLQMESLSKKLTTSAAQTLALLAATDPGPVNNNQQTTKIAGTPPEIIEKTDGEELDIAPNASGEQLPALSMRF